MGAVTSTAPGHAITTSDLHMISSELLRKKRRQRLKQKSAFQAAEQGLRCLKMIKKYGMYEEILTNEILVQDCHHKQCKLLQSQCWFCQFHMK